MTNALPNHPLADDAILTAVARALSELRRGALVILRHGTGAALIQSAEAVQQDGLATLRRLSPAEPLLLLTARRAAAIGLATSGRDAVALKLLDRPLERVIELADPTATKAHPLARPERGAAPRRLAEAAIDLTKLARLLPAALFAALPEAEAEAEALAEAENLLSVTADAVAEYRYAGARTLTQVASARVPLAGAEDTMIHAFRPGDGGLEHLAIVIGAPDPAQPVLTRLHSECFTGDLLGSLRCDCGPQLRGAIEAIAAAGSGILLYLAQEGRGIGLVNKLRAYELQDRGADTADANLQLGFDADERIYLPAAEMLRALGVRKLRLLTNNPEKVAGLERCGLKVSERVQHAFPANAHNRPYLDAKATRFGHLF